MTIYVPPSSLISAVLFSGSLVKQDGHGATLASSSSLPPGPAPPPPLERPTAPSEAATRRALVSTVLIATLLISALGLGRSYSPRYTYTKLCHERDQARIKYVGTVRVREIMRPPTNQSIRRHLSDCSLMLGCPVPPSLLVARTIVPPPLRTPYRKRTDAQTLTRASGYRVFDAYQRTRTENADRPALDRRDLQMRSALGSDFQKARNQFIDEQF